jgi:hypothetical protein
MGFFFTFIILVTNSFCEELHTYDFKFNQCKNLEPVIAGLMPNTRIACAGNKLLFMGKTTQWKKIVSLVKTLDKPLKQFRGTIRSNESLHTANQFINLKKHRIGNTNQSYSGSQSVMFQTLAGHPYKLNVSQNQMMLIEDFLVMQDKGLFIELTLQDAGSRVEATLELSSELKNQKTVYLRSVQYVNPNGCSPVTLHKDSPNQNSNGISNHNFRNSQTVSSLVFQATLCLQE